MSNRFELNKEDGIKILTGAGIATGGALLTYLLEILPNVNFGEFTPVIVAIFSILINAGKKFLEGKK